MSLENTVTIFVGILYAIIITGAATYLLYYFVITPMQSNPIIIHNETICNQYIILAQDNIPHGANLTTSWWGAPKECGTDRKIFADEWNGSLRVLTTI